MITESKISILCTWSAEDKRLQPSTITSPFQVEYVLLEHLQLRNDSWYSTSNNIKLEPHQGASLMRTTTLGFSQLQTCAPRPAQIRPYMRMFLHIV